MQLNENEMIDLWLLRKGYEPLRTDATVIRTDGVDIREIARLECRRWYDRLLLDADPSMLVDEELASDPSVAREVSPAGTLILTLPEEAVRPLSARLSGWAADAPVVCASSAAARRQTAPYAAAGPVAPLAVARLGGRLELFSIAGGPGSDTLESLRCICRRSDGDGAPVYSFRENALSTI